MELSYQVVKKAVQALSGSKRAVCQLWDYYRNDVDRPPYFPFLEDEEPDEYARRVKIAVGWIGAIANKIASYFCKPPIITRFTVDGKEDHPKAKEAAELWKALAKANSYDAFRYDVVRDAGVGGNGYTKERYVLFDKETGVEITTEADGKKWLGSVKIDRVSESFVYRLRDGKRIVYVEAWIYKDGKYQIISAATNAKDGDIEYIELIAPPSFHEQTGDNEDVSVRKIWKEQVNIFDEPIQYGYIPIQRWANLVSRPEVEDGISDIVWAVPMANAVNHIISGQVRSIEYHGWPRTAISGVEDEGDIINRPERTWYLPEGAKVDTLTWDQNLEGSHALTDRLVDFMSAITGVPKHMLHDLDGAGSVASGTALRIIYRNLEDACRLKEAGFKKADEGVVRASLDIMATHNDKKGYFDEVEISVEYNPDRTPKDVEKDKSEDQKELALTAINIVDYVLKHKPVEDRQGAIDWLLTRAEEKALIRDALKMFQFEPAEIDSIFMGGFKMKAKKVAQEGSSASEAEAEEVQEQDEPEEAEA